MAHVALLRAVNVGGRGKVAMPDLRDVLADLGFAEVETVLQTGNLVLGGASKSPHRIEQVIERGLAERLGLRTDALVRTTREWQQIIAANPFSNEAARDPSRLVLMVLKKAPSEQAIETLRSSVRGPETLRADGRQLYITYPAGIGRSKLSGALIESRLATRGTARNWNTVLRLGQAAEAIPG